MQMQSEKPVSKLPFFRLWASFYFTPQCELATPSASLVHGLRPIKSAIDKSVCEQPVYLCQLWHCSLPSWTLYHIVTICKPKTSVQVFEGVYLGAVN